MTSKNNLIYFLFREKCINGISYFFLIAFIIKMKANMNIASFTSWKWFHSNSKILDPVLCICTTSPRNNDILRNLLIANIHCSQGKVIIKVTNIHQFRKSSRWFTIPALNAFFWAICKWSIGSIDFRGCGIVVICWSGLFGDEMKSGNNKKQDWEIDSSVRHDIIKLIIILWQI